MRRGIGQLSTGKYLADENLKMYGLFAFVLLVQMILGEKSFYVKSQENFSLLKEVSLKLNIIIVPEEDGFFPRNIYTS